MTSNEREMIRPLTDSTHPPQNRFTSLQPTYEDSVSPEAEEWDDPDGAS